MTSDINYIDLDYAIYKGLTRIILKRNLGLLRI